MTEQSRRNFLKTAAALPLGPMAAVAGVGATGFVLPQAAAAMEPLKRVGGPHIKFSCNAYSFARALGSHARGKGGMSLFDLADFCAKAGFDGFDPTGYYFPGYQKDGLGVPTDKYIYDLKRHAFALGLGISGTGVGNNFTVADKAIRARDVQRIKAWAEVAGKLGAPVLRVFADTQMRDADWKIAANGASREQVEEWIANDIRECANHAANFGVFIGIQNHGDFLKTAADQINLIKRVDSQWCGAIVDTGFYRAPDPYAEMAKAAPYAVNWQVKQSPNGVANEKTHPTDIRRLIKIVLDSGYRGYLPIETLSPRGSAETYEPHKLVPEFLKQLRAELARQTA